MALTFRSKYLKRFKMFPLAKTLVIVERSPARLTTSASLNEGEFKHTVTNAVVEVGSIQTDQVEYPCRVAAHMPFSARSSSVWTLCVYVPTSYVQ